MSMTVAVTGLCVFSRGRGRGASGRRVRTFYDAGGFDEAGGGGVKVEAGRGTRKQLARALSLSLALILLLHEHSSNCVLTWPLRQQLEGLLRLKRGLVSASSGAPHGTPCSLTLSSKTGKSI